MPEGVNEINIRQVMGHWEITINGKFFCSADTYNEAVKELKRVYG